MVKTVWHSEYRSNALSSSKISVTVQLTKQLRRVVQSNMPYFNNQNPNTYIYYIVLIPSSFYLSHPLTGSRSTVPHYFHGSLYSYCAMGPFVQLSLQRGEHNSTGAGREARSSSVCSAKDVMTKTAKRLLFVQRFHVLSILLTNRLNSHVCTVIQDLLVFPVLPARRTTTEISLRTQVHSAVVAHGVSFYSALVPGIFNAA